MVLITWLAWLSLPTRMPGVHRRLTVFADQYEGAVNLSKQGILPPCLMSRECLSVSRVPPYLVFPMPGFSNRWMGVVYVPETAQAPLKERLESFGGDPVCDGDAIAPHYFICSFF